LTGYDHNCETCISTAFHAQQQCAEFNEAPTGATD
jgi:hypothetical protein